MQQILISTRFWIWPIPLGCACAVWIGTLYLKSLKIYCVYNKLEETDTPMDGQTTLEHICLIPQMVWGIRRALKFFFPILCYLLGENPSHMALRMYQTDFNTSWAHTQKKKKKKKLCTYRIFSTADEVLVLRCIPCKWSQTPVDTI